MRLAIAIILASLTFHSEAAVVRLINNFATTNSPSTLSNIVASIGGGAQVWTNSAGVIQPVGDGANSFQFDTNYGSLALRGDAPELVGYAGVGLPENFYFYVSGGDVSFTFDVTNSVSGGSKIGAKLSPTVGDGSPSYLFDTSIAHTSGNLLELKNNGTSLFVVAFDGSITGNGTIRVTNTSRANSYTDVGANGAITNINPNGGGFIMLSNAAAAGTYAYMQSPSNGANVKVLGSVSNSVEKFSVASSGPVVSESLTTSGGITNGGVLRLNGAADIGSSGLFSWSGSEFYVMGKSSTKLGLGAGYSTGGLGVKSGLWVSTDQSVQSATSLTATNGIILYQRETIPTNTIPSSSSSVTNWVLMNLTNTINSGGPMYVATNTAAAGSFLMARPTLTVTTFP